VLRAQHGSFAQHGTAAWQLLADFLLSRNRYAAAAAALAECARRLRDEGKRTRDTWQALVHHLGASRQLRCGNTLCQP
jgi:hypothetical protein